VLAGTLRLAVVALGGWMLAEARADTWTIFALAGGGMVAYGLAMAVLVHRAKWGPKKG
jgi:hypothetical protein